MFERINHKSNLSHTVTHVTENTSVQEPLADISNVSRHGHKVFRSASVNHSGGTENDVIHIGIENDVPANSTSPYESCEASHLNLANVCFLSMQINYYF